MKQKKASPGRGPVLHRAPRGARGLHFVAAAARPEEFPDLGFPSAALIGRSNVGKSSFLNALAGGKAIARTSRTPGRTRSVNFYRVEDAVIVDLPGYGYAQVSKEERNRWKIVVESYLNRSELRLAILLVDARTGATASDLSMGEWLKHRGVPTRVVVTKADKLGRDAARKAVEDAARTLAVAVTDAQAFSAVTGEGAIDVWKVIEDALRLESRETPS